MLQDRSFNEDGSLDYPESFEPNVAGDTTVINGAVWPNLEVDPRRYRLRFINTSNGRTYNLQLENESDRGVPTLYQFAAGHGFLDRVVSIGPGGDLDSLLLGAFERGDVIVDFSDYAGETFTVTNDAAFPFQGLDDHDDHNEHDESEPPLDDFLQIQVSDSHRMSEDTSADPTELKLPPSPGTDEHAARKTRQMTMQMDMDEDMHPLNGRRFYEETVVKPNAGPPKSGNSRTKPTTPTRSTCT